MEKTMKKYFPLFVLPTLVAFLIAFVVPFVMGVYLSFVNLLPLPMQNLWEQPII